MEQFSSTKVEGSEGKFCSKSSAQYNKTKALGKVGRPFDKGFELQFIL